MNLTHMSAYVIILFFVSGMSVQIDTPLSRVTSSGHVLNEDSYSTDRALQAVRGIVTLTARQVRQLATLILTYVRSSLIFSGAFENFEVISG
jgi:hypothetical protein